MSTRAEFTNRIAEQLQLVIASSVMTNERVARSMGLHVVDLQAFGYVARSAEPMTAGEVSQLTQLPTSTTTRVLDRLEKQGFLERTTDTKDRRRVVVRARADAMARMGDNGGDAYRSILDGMKRVHEKFTLEELAIVERYLEAIKNVR